jgi:hypothetical protein
MFLVIVRLFGIDTIQILDPIFFMHHAVRTMRFRFLLYLIDLETQMVDKVWYDWQNKHSSNFWSFEGGSIQAIANLTEYTEYPNGLPPAMTVGYVTVLALY